MPPVNEAPVEQQVFVVDDDEAQRDSLVWLLESHKHKVGAFSRAEDFLAVWNEALAGCLVLDVRMPGMSGLELFEELCRRRSPLPVIFITGHGDVPMAVAALKKGAADFIEKPFAAEDMLRLVDGCLAHEREARTRRRGEADTARRLTQLTAREREVLGLIVAGKLNKQIADALGISIKTVEVHRARVMEKMGAHSLACLVRQIVSVETDKAER
ncbi:MAG: response regulator [Azoarcus sp.]|jgi:FixJ family two-component response regulator|nr:response regulator [Azoarcus sp.]